MEMKKEDIKIAYVGELDRTPDAPDHLGIRQGLNSFNGLVIDPVLNDEAYVINAVNAFKPDLIIHGNTDSLSRRLASRIKNTSGAKQVFWMLDYQPSMEKYSEWHNWITERGAYDMIFLSNKDQIKYWADGFQCPTEYLPHGCVVDKLKYDLKFDMDVVFIGGHSNNDWYANRFHLIEDILKLYPVKIHTGSGVEGRNQVWRDMPYIYHTSSAVLDISHSWDARGYASGRYFYSAGLGGCSITKRFPDCEDLYPEGAKLYFDTPEEAFDLIEKVKADKKFQGGVKQKAWEINKDKHNYTLRFKHIIKCLSI